MGFGISDADLEKALSDAWVSCSSDRYGFSPYTPTYYKPYETRRNPVKITPVTVTTTVVKTAVKEVDKNLLLLSAIFNEIQSLYAERDSFWSEEYKTVVSQVYEYFDNIIKLNSLELLKIYGDDDIEKARNYLFDGFSECIYFYLTHNILDKPKLRNLVEDTLRLVRKWNMFEIASGTVSKQIFFDYYIKRYGLIKNEYHCCPHCGSYIIQGVYNCPNCYAQTDIIPTRKKRPVQQVESEIEAPEETVIAQPQDDTSEILRVKLQESDDEMRRIQEANERLLLENERLRAELEGKNVAIKAMSDYISENSADEIEYKKVLIIGDIPMNVQEVLDMSAQIGIAPEMIDILDDFSKIKKLAGRIRNDDKYAGIIIGAVPHKVSKLGDASSLSTLFRGSGFPFLVEARTYQGELKITKESLRRALNDMMFHLLSMGLI